MSNILDFVSGAWILFSRLELVSKFTVTVLLGYVGLQAFKQIGKSLIIGILRITRNKNNPTDVQKYDPSKIYLHIFFRRMTKNVPNLSPFAIKLETWFRLKDIAYETVETRAMSNATRQIPYINHKGKEITDSDLIMEYAEKEFELDPSEGLQSQDIAVARAFRRMVDEATAYTYLIHRYCFEYKDFTRVFGTPFQNWFGKTMFHKMFPNAMKMAADARGIGRKRPSEVYHISNEDIRAISAYLGDKTFMMGDLMTKVDCAIFGHLSQIVFVDFHYPQKDFIEEECTNLLPYLERIRTKYWPDWNSIVSTGHFS